MSHSMDGYDDPYGRELEARRPAELKEKIVQVRIAGATRRTYAYQVPFDIDLEVGDWVTIPGNVVSEFGGYGIVKGFGRQGYNGPLKTITAKIPEPDEIMVRMSVVKSKDQAAQLYDRAMSAGWSDAELLALQVLGEARLKARGVR